MACLTRGGGQRSMATQQDNWEAVKALLAAALQEDAGTRSPFLKERCPDASVCAEMERLLPEHDQTASSFLPTELPAVSLNDFIPEPAARNQQLSVSQVLAGRFRIVRWIAGGSMGEGYEAEDQQLRERLAVKTPRDFAPDLSTACEAVILRGLAGDPAERFASARAVTTALVIPAAPPSHREPVATSA